MDGLLTDRVALITGAGSGIGEGIAQAMAKAGACIIAVDIDGEAAKRTATAIGGRCIGQQPARYPPRCLRRPRGRRQARYRRGVGTGQQCRDHPPRKDFRPTHADRLGRNTGGQFGTVRTT